MSEITRKDICALINYFNGYGSPFDDLIMKLASKYLRKGWNYFKYDKPKNGQEVLVYWYEEDYETEQIHILTYFEKGTVIEDPAVEVVLTGKGTKVIADSDGFYIYENSKWRKHADLITHWQPLPEDPILPEYEG
ncbi:hypothetical protein KQI76_06925 [Amphibacillus sp. MSJ-3]|uniref:hypothetical protein n=1 Tax=Amphibacillus sp. MSJ-3 TaxID=2841505 RepID=UPI001C0EF228|nr:hypothetical protein [Amphibacillus sp. MSJ-3]MBU5594894.1 hypothetical protein [Amphibacillus sp. MSJ-3]